MQHVYKSGTIRSSLYGATDAAGIPDAIANQMARIFSTDIDFHIDLRKGDRFTRRLRNALSRWRISASGPRAVRGIHQQRQGFEAYLFTDAEGNDGYYSADGRNRAKSFLRSALAFSRMSSGFGGRFHPLLKNWRQHTGVDFAAPRGTPIWATADGTVEFAGVKGGYGNVIEIRHTAASPPVWPSLRLCAGVRAAHALARDRPSVMSAPPAGRPGRICTTNSKCPAFTRIHCGSRCQRPNRWPQNTSPPSRRPRRLQGEQLALLRDTRFGRFE